MALTVRGALAGASAWLLALTLAGAALAVGTVHTLTLCIVAAALAGCTVLAWWDAEPARVRLPATVLVLTALVLTGYTAVQCVPLPVGLLAHIAPRNADVWARVFAPLREAGPSWAPISLDPTASRVEVLKGVAYLLAFLTALRVARRRRGMAFLSSVLIVIGVLLAVLALLHPAFGAKRLYGVWEPVFNYDRHLAPFLNPNNLASYLNVAFCLALAAALVPEPRVPRVLLATAVVLLAATQVWVASRGGVATMLLGAVLVIAMVRTNQMHGPKTIATTSLLAGVALTAGAFMLVLGASEQSSTELTSGDTSKLQLFAESMRMLSAYPIFGVGRGAFESTFPALRQSTGFVTYAYPENVIAQWTIEWGLPLGLLGLAAITYALRPNAVLVRSATAAGAWAAIVVVAVQNLVDLGSEVAGLALALVVCSAIVVGGSAGRSPRWRIERWARVPRLVAVAAGTLAALAIAAAAPGIGHDVMNDRYALEHAAVEGHVSAAAMNELARAAMRRHPGEPFLPFAVALRAVTAKDADPMRWIGATLERANVYGAAHLLLARYIAPRSPSQGRFEYRLAMDQAPDLAPEALDEAPRWIGRYDDAMELVPEGVRGLRPLEVLAVSLYARLPATSVELDQEQTRRDPTAPGPAIREAGAWEADVDGGDGVPWCTGALRSECVKHALDASRRAVRLAPTECLPYAYDARLQVATGSAVAGMNELAEASDRVSNRVACLRELVAVATAQRDDKRVADAMTRIINAGCTEDAECAGNLAWVGAMEESRGNTAHARLLYKQAYERAPDQDLLLESAARLSSAGGLHAEAAADYDLLTRRHPENPSWKKAAEAEHQAALRAAMQL